MKNNVSHTVNGWAKLVRTPRFQMQVVKDKVKHTNKFACRRPTTSPTEPETV